MLTDRLSPQGAPMAMTKSPSVRDSDSPRVAWGRGGEFSGSSSLRRATSVSLSAPRTRALKARPSYRRQRTSVALSTTCQLERISPSGLMTTPLPLTSWLRFSPRCRSSRRHLMKTTAGKTRSLPCLTTSRKSGADWGRGDWARSGAAIRARPSKQEALWSSMEAGCNGMAGSPTHNRNKGREGGGVDPRIGMDSGR